jgi:hypothetical protein
MVDELLSGKIASGLRDAATAYDPTGELDAVLATIVREHPNFRRFADLSLVLLDQQCRPCEVPLQDQREIADILGDRPPWLRQSDPDDYDLGRAEARAELGGDE